MQGLVPVVRTAPFERVMLPYTGQMKVTYEVTDLPDGATEVHHVYDFPICHSYGIHLLHGGLFFYGNFIFKSFLRASLIGHNNQIFAETSEFIYSSNAYKKHFVELDMFSDYLPLAAISNDENLRIRLVLNRDPSYLWGIMAGYRYQSPEKFGEAQAMVYRLTRRMASFGITDLMIRDGRLSFPYKLADWAATAKGPSTQPQRRYSRNNHRQICLSAFHHPPRRVLQRPEFPLSLSAIEEGEIVDEDDDDHMY